MCEVKDNKALYVTQINKRFEEPQTCLKRRITKFGRKD